MCSQLSPTQIQYHFWRNCIKTRGEGDTDLYLKTERSHHLSLVSSPGLTSLDHPSQPATVFLFRASCLSPDRPRHTGQHTGSRPPDTEAELRSREEPWCPGLRLLSDREYWQELLTSVLSVRLQHYYTPSTCFQISNHERYEEESSHLCSLLVRLFMCMSKLETESSVNTRPVLDVQNKQICNGIPVTGYRQRSLQHCRVCNVWHCSVCSDTVGVRIDGDEWCWWWRNMVRRAWVRTSNTTTSPRLSSQSVDCISYRAPLHHPGLSHSHLRANVHWASPSSGCWTDTDIIYQWYSPSTKKYCPAHVREFKTLNKKKHNKDSCRQSHFIRLSVWFQWDPL